MPVNFPPRCSACRRIVPPAEYPPPRQASRGEQTWPGWFLLVAGVALVVAVAWLLVVMRLLWAAGTWFLTP